MKNWLLLFLIVFIEQSLSLSDMVVYVTFSRGVTPLASTDSCWVLDNLFSSAHGAIPERTRPLSGRAGSSSDAGIASPFQVFRNIQLFPPGMGE